MSSTSKIRFQQKNYQEALSVLELLSDYCVDLNSNRHFQIQDIRLAVHALQLIFLFSTLSEASVEKAVLTLRSAVEVLERDPMDRLLFSSRLSGAIEEIRLTVNQNFEMDFTSDLTTPQLESARIIIKKLKDERALRQQALVPKK